MSDDTTNYDADEQAGVGNDQEVNGAAADDTFPRSYVEELRQENGKWRQRAQRADDLAHRLHTALVAATGRLADPETLEYADEHIDDPEALTAAIDALLEDRPYLAARRARGNVGQGVGTAQKSGVDLAGILRTNASNG